MQRTRNLAIVLIALAAIVGIALYAARHAQRDDVAVKMETVTLKPFTVKLPENGVVMRPLTQTIPTLVAGNIERILVKAGDRVAEGQLLATVDNPTLRYQAAGSQEDYNSSVANVSSARVNEQNARVQYQGTVDTAKTNLEEAQRIYNADAALFAQRAISRNQLDTDRAKLQQARVSYNEAVQQLRLGAVSGYGQNSVKYAESTAEKSRILNEQNQQQVAFTRITAPFGGLIQTVAAQPNDPLRSLQPGDTVTAGQALFTIAGGSGYIVKAEVDEQDIINVRVGQRALVGGQDFPGKNIVGRVAQIAPVAIKSTDTSSTAKQVLTTIALESSPEYLKDGLTADVDILTSDIPRAISVPNDAVVKDGTKSYVYVVSDGVARKRQITVGRVGDTRTLVKSGLVAGDRIVAQKPVGVTDGTPVKASPSPSP
jgi:HlyD family secretion protein